MTVLLPALKKLVPVIQNLCKELSEAIKEGTEGSKLRSHLYRFLTEFTGAFRGHSFIASAALLMIISEHRNKSDDKAASRLFNLSYRAVKYVRHYCSLHTNRVREFVAQASKGELTGSMECIAGSIGLLRLSSENRRLTKDTLIFIKGLIEYVCYEELDLSSAKEVCEMLEINIGDSDALLRMTDEETAEQWENRYRAAVEDAMRVCIQRNEPWRFPAQQKILEYLQEGCTNPLWTQVMGLLDFEEVIWEQLDFERAWDFFRRAQRKTKIRTKNRRRKTAEPPKKSDKKDKKDSKEKKDKADKKDTAPASRPTGAAGEAYDASKRGTWHGKALGEFAPGTIDHLCRHFVNDSCYSGADCPFSHDEKAKVAALKLRQASADDAVPEEGFKGLKKAPKDSKTVRWQQVITLGRGPVSWSEGDASDPDMHSNSGSGTGSGSGLTNCTQPTAQPVDQPTAQPTAQPAAQPAAQQAVQPTAQPKGPQWHSPYTLSQQQQLDKLDSISSGSKPTRFWQSHDLQNSSEPGWYKRSQQQQQQQRDASDSVTQSNSGSGSGSGSGFNLSSADDDALSVQDLSTMAGTVTTAVEFAFKYPERFMPLAAKAEELIFAAAGGVMDTSAGAIHAEVQRLMTHLFSLDLVSREDEYIDEVMDLIADRSRVLLTALADKVDTDSDGQLVDLPAVTDKYDFSANLYGELLSSDHSVLSMILRNSFTVLEYAMGVNTQPTDEQLWVHLSLTCIWPVRHQQSSSLMLRSMSLLSTDSSEDAIESLPDDHSQWLYRVTDGEQGRPARTVRQPAPFLKPAILGDTVDHALLAEHGASDLLFSDSCSSADLDSSDLQE